jgi:putative salt-induced outer membrane protein YdiY
VRIRIAVSLILALAMPALADQITLKNGDRITGAIVKADGKQLVLKTDYAGEITVKLDAIQNITSTGDLHVGLKDGKTLVGPVTTSGDQVVVATKAAGPVEAPRSSVAELQQQAAYEKSLHPGLREGWAGSLNLGLALTRGNSETKNLNVALNATRKGFKDKLILYFNSVDASKDLPAPSQTTARFLGGGARYDHDITSQMFGFVNSDFYHDSLQNLDLRYILGGGLGWHTIKSDSTTLDLLAGANYTHESYSAFILPSPPNPPNTLVPAVTHSLAGLTLGDEFTYKAGKSTNFQQTLFFYPDMSNPGEYRGTFNLGTVTKINKWLGWQNTFGDVYVSNPPTGKKQNDLLFSTGLNFSFAH